MQPTNQIQLNVPPLKLDPEAKEAQLVKQDLRVAILISEKMKVINNLKKKELSQP